MLCRWLVFMEVKHGLEALGTGVTDGRRNQTLVL